MSGRRERVNKDLIVIGGLVVMAAALIAYLVYVLTVKPSPTDPPPVRR